MKKYFYIALTTVLALGAAACSSSNNPDPEPGPGEMQLTLKASKTTVEADAQDVVEFTVTDQNGKDYTNESTMHFQNKDTGEFIDSKWTFFDDGKYTIRARYNGVYSNEVVITAQNHAKYEKYYRNVAIYQMTDVECLNCPKLSVILEKLEEKDPGRLVRMAFHGKYSKNDPFEIPATGELVSIFGINGWPTAIVDMREKTVGSAFAGVDIQPMINKSRQDLAACGIKINSSVSGRTATITTEIAFDKDGEYSVGYAVLADNLQAAQAGAEAGYRHNATVRAISGVMGGAIGEQKAGTTWTQEPAFTVELGNEPIEDTRVVVFVLRKTADNKWYINNIATCAADGGSVDYKLNK